MEPKIKFRLWNNIQNKMLPHDRINFDFIFDGEDHHDFNLMQFVGFKDAYGTDIYEGDILIARYKKVGKMYDNQVIEVLSSDNSDWFVKEWDEYLKVKITVTDSSFGFKMPTRQGGYGGKDYFIKWKVIGNIYETPDINIKNENSKVYKYEG